MFHQLYRSIAVERLTCPAPILATMEETQATVPWVPGAGPELPGRLNHAQISRSTSKEKRHSVKR
jgi:hypothetical protein